MEDSKEKDYYNDIPVFYCKKCLSLKIRYVSGYENMDYCDECGSTNIGTCSILEWEEMFKKKYGYKFLGEKKGKYCLDNF